MDNKLKLKELGRQIAKFPNNRFRSNAVDSQFMRLSHYIHARTNKVDSSDIEQAEDELSKLKNNENISWALLV